MRHLIDQILILATGSGCVIGFFLAIVFVRRKQRNPRTNLVMGLLLIVLACSAGLNALLGALIPKYFPFLLMLPEPFLLLIGPIFYEYIHRVSGSKRSFRHACLHLLPFVLTVGFLTYLLAGSPETPPGDLAHLIGAVWLAIYIHFWVYFFLNRKRLRIYKNGLKATHSAMEGIYHSWIDYCLNALLICYSVLGILFFLQHIIILLPINQTLALVLAVMIYCIGYRILVQPELFTYPPEGTGENLRPQGPKYEKSGLRRETVTGECGKVLQFIATQKPYADPELDLKRLAEMLELSPHHLSQIINTELETNFYDFVNGYRVEEAKRLILDKANNHLTLIRLAFEAGFNSKATFNRMFKKVTKQTPSRFRREHARD